jgi:peptidoglycan/LPS O-acetylase OafA/YrhL
VQTRAEQLNPLTGLRGVAACAVLIAHALDTSFNYGDYHPMHSFASRLAYFGMSLFFVLSGFVIQYNYASFFSKQPLGMAAWEFFVARFARLYPLYILSIFATLTYLPEPNFTPLITLAYLTLTQSWCNVEMAAFPADWSVSTEWFFYFAFIPLTMLIAKSRRPLLALILTCTVGFFGLMLLFHFWKIGLTDIATKWFSHGENVSADPGGWLLYFSPYVRLIEFVCGMLAARAYRPSARRRSVIASAIIIISITWCVAVICIEKMTSTPWLADLLTNFIYAPAIVAAMLCFCQYGGLLANVLSSRLMMFLGEISFSIYVWSFFAMSMFTESFRSTEPSIIAYLNSSMRTVMLFGLTIVCAYGSYKLIERPARTWIRRARVSRSELVAGRVVHQHGATAV